MDSARKCVRGAMTEDDLVERIARDGNPKTALREAILRIGCLGWWKVRVVESASRVVLQLENDSMDAIVEMNFESEIAAQPRHSEWFACWLPGFF